MTAPRKYTDEQIVSILPENQMTSPAPIATVSGFLEIICRESQEWKPVFPWFRGERDVDFSKLLPQVFRDKYDENNLLQSFRRRAHLLNLPVAPPVTSIDQWLFLARHVGLPTRLLDWTEGALIALYFALTKVEEYERARKQVEADKLPAAGAVVWMLNPMRLNRLAQMVEIEYRQLPQTPDPEPRGNFYPLTWFDPPIGMNMAFENIACAWEQKKRGIQLPVAVEPTTIHPRMNAQHSYFTVHGLNEMPLHEVVSNALDYLRDKEKCPYMLGDLLRRYELAVPAIEGIAQLRTMGIADSTIMPDADSLATELARFMRTP
jgi:hypothetical protein